MGVELKLRRSKENAVHFRKQIPYAYPHQNPPRDPAPTLFGRYALRLLPVRSLGRNGGVRVTRVSCQRSEKE